MTELSRRILKEYQIRKGKRRKRAFVDFLLEGLEGSGVPARVEEARAFARSRNVVIGDPERAKLILAAHYDTCAAMPLPNFITPKNVPVYLAYQFGLAGLIILLALGAAYLPVLFGWLDGFRLPLFSIIMLACSWLLVFGPANRHTANDNTSGVIGVVETALALPEELREKVAFVLFDNEELGVLGSAGFAHMHPEVKKRACLLNLDCVSDGDIIMLVLPKKCPAELERLLSESFVPGNGKEVLLTSARDTFYPSDHMNFRHGVGIAAIKKTRRGLLYMDRLHTDRDTVFDERNIAFIRDAVIRATKVIDN